MTDLEKLKLLTGESDEALLSLLLSDAQEFALTYTNRSRMIPQLAKPIRDLAVAAYNRMGTEGESGRSEGGCSYSFDAAPKQIYDAFNLYRLARVGGRSYENKEKHPEAVPPSEPDSNQG